MNILQAFWLTQISYIVLTFSAFGLALDMILRGDLGRRGGRWMFIATVCTGLWACSRAAGMYHLYTAPETSTEWPVTLAIENVNLLDYISAGLLVGIGCAILRSLSLMNANHLAESD